MLIGIASTYAARHEGQISSVEQRFAQAGRERGCDVVHIDPLRCSYELRSNRAEIRLSGEVLQLDGLLIRRAAHHWNAVKTLVLMAHETGAVCIDRRETFLGTLSGKFQALLRRYQLPENRTPVSFLYFRRDAVAADPPPADAWPLLTKPLRGSLGRGIRLVQGPQELLSVVRDHDFREPLMLQKRVEGREYRALMLETRCLGVVAKEPGPDGFGNVARGAVFQPASPNQTKTVCDLATAIMAEAPYDFAAVDVILDDAGDAWVLECNRNPHFAGFETALPDVDVPAAVMEILHSRIQERTKSR